MAIVLGLTGPNASGKGEVAALLSQKGFHLHSLSDVVREAAAAEGLPPEREHLIRIGNALRAAEGAGVLARRILPRLRGRNVVDSVRNPAEVAVLREVVGFHLLGVTAPLELRFRRALARGRAGDPQTLAEFRRREAQENTADPTAQQLDATLELADAVLVNDGDLQQLRAAVEHRLAAWDAAC